MTTTIAPGRFSRETWCLVIVRQIQFTGVYWCPSPWVLTSMGRSWSPRRVLRLMLASNAAIAARADFRSIPRKSMWATRGREASRDQPAVSLLEGATNRVEVDAERRPGFAPGASLEASPPAASPPDGWKPKSRAAGRGHRRDARRRRRSTSLCRTTSGARRRPCRRRPSRCCSPRGGAVGHPAYVTATVADLTGAAAARSTTGSRRTL